MPKLEERTKPRFLGRSPSDDFRDTERCLADYDSGRFCWETAPIYGETSSYCGEGCISRGYVLNHWTRHFKLIDYIDDREICPQNVIVMKK